MDVIIGGFVKSRFDSSVFNRPCSIYQYSNVAPIQTSIFGVVLFVSKSILEIEKQKQERITRSLQLPHIPVTAFSQTDLFLV